MTYLDKTSINNMDIALNKLELAFELQLNPDMYKNRSSGKPTTPYYIIPKKSTNHSSIEHDRLIILMLFCYRYTNIII